jgi:hypothetical protein
MHPTDLITAENSCAARAVHTWTYNDCTLPYLGWCESRPRHHVKADMQTLKHANRDGFERLVMDLVKDGFGGHACALVHCRFHEMTEKTVCRVIAERSADPVYLVEGGTARLMLRIGNSTRELDVREAQAHLRNRSPGRA